MTARSKGTIGKDAPIHDASEAPPRAAPRPVEISGAESDDPLQALRRMYQTRAVLEVDGVRWVWDFAAQEAVAEADMPEGSARFEASERARYQHFREQFDALIEGEVPPPDA